MKKMMLMAAAAMCFAAPALAHEEHAEKKADMYFSKMDTDGNGSISMSESQAFSNRMFEEADTNNDDMLSMDEMKAHKKSQMREHGMMHGHDKMMDGKMQEKRS